jgi:hypothetical protein
VSFEQRLVVISLAAFAVGGALGAMAVPWLAARLTAVDPSRRARLFLRLRGLPAVSACGAMGLVLASFVLFEPRTPEEATGLVLGVLAGVTVVLWWRTVVRAVVLWRSTRVARRIWMTGARPVSVPWSPPSASFGRC